MSKNRDLQALPDDFPLLDEVQSGIADVESLNTIFSLLHAIRTGRMTDRRIDHVRQHYDADEIALYEMAIRLADEQPNLLDLHLDLVSKDEALELFLGQAAAKQKKDADLGQHTIRGFKNLKPIDAEIGWSTSQQVSSIHNFLSSIAFEDLCAEFNPDQTTSGASPQQVQVSLEPLLEKTKSFYRQASEARLAVLSVRWG